MGSHTRHLSIWLLALVGCTGGGSDSSGDGGMPPGGGLCPVGGEVTIDADDEAALAATLGGLATRRVFAVRDDEKVHLRIQLTDGTAALEITVNIPLDATAGGVAVRQGEDEDEVHATATTRMQGISGVDSDVLRDVHETTLTWEDSPLQVGDPLRGRFDLYLKTDCGRRIDHLRVRGSFSGEILNPVEAFSLIEPCLLRIGNLGNSHQQAGRLDLAVDGEPVVIDNATVHADYTVDRGTVGLGLNGPIGQTYEVQVSDARAGSQPAFAQWIHDGCHYFTPEVPGFTLDSAPGDEAGTTGSLDLEVPLADDQMPSAQCPPTRRLTGTFTLAVCTWYLGDDP